METSNFPPKQIHQFSTNFSQKSFKIYEAIPNSDIAFHSQEKISRSFSLRFWQWKLYFMFYFVVYLLFYIRGVREILKIITNWFFKFLQDSRTSQLPTAFHHCPKSNAKKNRQRKINWIQNNPKKIDKHKLQNSLEKFQK